MSNDFYLNDNDDEESYHKTVALCVAAASLVVLLFLVFLYMNTEKNKPDMKATVEEETVEEDDFLADSHNFTSDELDFWEDVEVDDDATLETESEGQATKYKNKNKDKNSTESLEGRDKHEGDAIESDSSSEKKKHDEEDDGDFEDDGGEGSLNKDAEDVGEGDDRIAVTDEKGVKKYYEILSSVDKNPYDLENNLVTDNGALQYKDGNKVSSKGVDLSKYNGTVDFVKLKECGIDYAMLRLGSRGYGTGLITLDEKFVEYAQNAALNNISIGAYFYSQAITEAEAIEEANYIVGAVGTFMLKYPIAIDIEKVTDDDARTDNLTTKQRTAVVKAFCDTVKSFGYKPCIYADRDMLISGLNLEDLDGYDIWLSDDNIPTDFPYKFTMWQYTDSGRIDGITGNVDMDLCFVNYEQR